MSAPDYPQSTEEALITEFAHASSPKEIARLGTLAEGLASAQFLKQKTLVKLGRVAAARLADIQEAHNGKS